MTTGAAASKKARLSAPVASHSDWARSPSVKGPVATMSASTPTASSSRLLARRREISMQGWAQRRAVTSPENASRSTASAPPAATRLRIAISIRCDPSAESSALSIPAALSGLVLLSEFEHTSSAALPVLCTAVPTSGRISTSSTRMPRSASWSAASLPASPAPKMRTTR